MHRFYIEEKINSKSSIEPNKDLKHYLTKVVRIKEDEAISVFNGEVEFTATFNGEMLSINDEITPKEARQTKMRLYQPLLENQKMSLVIQKSTEIGVDEIILYKSERTKSKNVMTDNKLSRFEKITKETAEQCGRITIPLIKFLDFDDINPSEEETLIVSSTRAGEQLTGALDGYRKEVSVIVGPEGGFSETEENSLIDKGAKPVNLKTNILRTETATIYNLAVIAEIVK